MQVNFCLEGSHVQVHELEACVLNYGQSVFKTQKCKIASWTAYRSSLHTSKKIKCCSDQRSMTAKGFKWLVICSQEIDTGQREWEYMYILLCLHAVVCFLLLISKPLQHECGSLMGSNCSNHLLIVSDVFSFMLTVISNHFLKPKLLSKFLIVSIQFLRTNFRFWKNTVCICCTEC